jgi:nitrite reductase/ring-hydroxylating ferredoxin subunit
LKFVGRVPRALIEAKQLLRMKYPPWDVMVTIVEGEPFAVEDACNHAGASLSEGELDESGKCIVCPMHAYVFDLKTGKCLAPVGLCDDQRTFVARLEGDDVAVYDPANVVIVK